MTNKPKAIGTAAETAVRNYLLSLGFNEHQARRNVLAGAEDRGDVHLVVNDQLLVCFEVKGGAAAKTASTGQIEKWMLETTTEQYNSGARKSVLVCQKAGVGPKNAGQWYAYTFLAQIGLPDISGDVIIRLSLEDYMQVILVAN